jgi:hypothetical protein
MKTNLILTSIKFVEVRKKVDEVTLRILDEVITSSQSFIHTRHIEVKMR